MTPEWAESRAQDMFDAIRAERPHALTETIWRTLCEELIAKHEPDPLRAIVDEVVGGMLVASADDIDAVTTALRAKGVTA